MKRFLLSILFFVGIFSVVLGQAPNFIAQQDGLWNDGSTWGNSGNIEGVDFPGASDVAFTSNYSIIIEGPVEIDFLYIKNDVPNAITFADGGFFTSSLLVKNAIKSSSNNGAARIPTAEIILNNEYTNIIFDGSNTSGSIIQSWGPNAPLTGLKIDAGLNNTLDLNSNISINGTFDILSGELILNSGFTISQTTNSTINISNDAFLTINGNITGDGSATSKFNRLVVNGTFNVFDYCNFDRVDLGSNGVINNNFESVDNQLEGWWYRDSAPTNFVFSETGTVNYGTNSPQNVFAISTGYGNLNLNASSTVTKTLEGTGNLLVKGDLNIQSGSVTFNSNNINPITLEGNVTNNGTWTTTQQVNFTGTNDQVINGSNPITFGEEVRIDKSQGTVTLDLVDQINNADLRIQNGTFRPLARTVTLSGNIINDGTIEATQNGSGGFIFDGTTEISGTGETRFRNITINNGASLTQDSGKEIEVTTNFTNNGTYTHNQGLVRFTASGAKEISGTSKTSFYDLAVEDGTLSVLDSVDLENVMTFAGSPTVDFDGSSGSGVFTLKSILNNDQTASQDASIGNIGTANLQGNITVERAIYNTRADGQGYHLMGFPVSGVTVEDVQNEIGITGDFTGADTGFSGDGFASVFSYNESAGGGINDRYVEFPTSSNTETFEHGLGYYVFTYEGEAPTTVDGRGAVFSGTFEADITLTAGPTAEDEGWNLIANPFPAATDWGLWTKPEGVIEGGSAHIFNSNSAAFEVITSGNIPQGQAFFVKAIGNGTISATEATKVTGTTPTFFRQAEPDRRIQIGLDDGNYEDITYIGFSKDATDAYEGKLDVSRFLNFNETISTLSSDDRKLKINNLAEANESSCERSIFISLEKMKNNKDYALKFHELDLFKQYNFILIDNYLGESIPLNNSIVYDFRVNSDAASKGQSRFELVIENKQPNEITTIANDVCPNQSAIVKLQNTDNFVNYIISYNNQLISSAKGNGSEIELEIDNEYLSNDINEFDIKAFIEGCDTLAVGSTQIQVKESLSLDNIVEGSSICKSETQAPFNLVTQLGANYYILNGNDTLQTIQGTGNPYEGFISAEELKDGRNEFVIAAEKDDCQNGTLNQVLEINLDNLVIDESIEFTASNVCVQNPTSIDFSSQTDVEYQLYKNDELVNSILGNGSNQSLEVSAEFLSEGVNEFSVLAVYGECAEFEYANTIQIEVEDSINQDLEIATLNSCGVQQVSVIIENAQNGKTYSLLKADSPILSSTATEDGDLSFELDADLFEIGENEFEILIEGQNCESLRAYSKVKFGFYNSVEINDVANQNICLNDTLNLDLSANVDLVKYQLYVGEELILEDVGSSLSLSPKETTTYSLTGVHENGCEVNTVNFTVEVTDLATPGILVSANILESSVIGDAYQWYLDGEILANETGKILVANQAGDYSVEVTKANCRNLSDTFTFNEEVLNANKALQNSLRVYPNPVDDKMYVDLEHFESVEVTIFTLSGQFIDAFKLKENQTEIDMTKFSKGTYLIQFETENASVTKRVVKQ